MDPRDALPDLRVLPPWKFWTNRRGHRLHLRCVVPTEPTTAILWLHGYGFHADLERMWKKVCHISESLNSLVIACDLEGHGYSDGPQTIENCENLVQDVVDLCMDLFTSTSAGSTFSTEDDLGSLKRTLVHQKLFLGGESFGGAIALQASLQCCQSIPQLKGLLLAAPFLSAPSRSPTLLSRGGDAVQKLPVGQATVPMAFLSKYEGKQVFSDELDIQDFNADRRGHTAGALGFHHLPMSATTAAALVGMIQSLPGKMSELELPFLVLHDPEDAITPLSGTELLMKLSKSRYKEFVPVPGGLHAPHFNQIEFCESKIRSFMLNAIAAAEQGTRISNVERVSLEAWPDPSKDLLHGQHLAAERWPAQNRVAPLLSFCFLVGHASMVASPLLLLVAGSWFTWCLGALVLLYALLGSFFFLAAVRFVWHLQKARSRFHEPQPGTVGNLFECQVRHLVCVAICAEPDLMILTTLQQLNASSSAPRMRVVFAMEEATDRPLERFELYQQQLPNVASVSYHIHPVKHEEVPGLCSSLAFSLGREVKLMSSSELERYVLTKVDSQVLLPLNYFPELEWSVQHRYGCSPVVWQPVLAGLMNRHRSIGAMRALTSMRCFSYPGIFALNLMCVTCYSAPLMQYVKMGLHHPNYLGEDCMMLAQATISEGHSAQLAVLPVVVAVAPPLDASCWGALREAARQGARWAAQVAEVAEFRWRYRAPKTTISTISWLVRYWFVRLALINGIGLFASSLSLAAALAPELPEVEKVLLFWMDKLMLVVLVSLLLMMPLYEQLMAHFFVAPKENSLVEAPWKQLPFTMLSAPVAILTNTIVDLWAWYRHLLLGKAGIVIRQRKKVSLDVEVVKVNVIESGG